MMEDVPEHEQQGGPPPALQPPHEPAPLDPDQVRQFQQFQQFQELMRQQPAGAQLPLPVPGPPPPPKPPLWQKALRSKLFRRLAVLAVIVLTAPIWWSAVLTGIASLVTDVFGSHKDNRPASETGGGLYHTNHILKDNPYDAVRQVYERVADNSPDFACGVFSDEAAQQFAEHVNAPDCPNAIKMLNAQVDNAPGSMNAYAEPDFHGKMGEKPSADSITISSCELGVTAGPRLGAFTVSRVDKGQWLITGHRRESC